MLPGTKDFSKLINAVNLIGISTILLLAFITQIGLSELPCPLCLLQRIGLLSIGFGFLLNIHYGTRPLHYALSLFATAFTATAALRQVVMNSLPPHGYGFPVFGIHLYTWNVLICFAMIIYIGLLLCIPNQYQNMNRKERITEAKTPVIRSLGHFAYAFFLLMLLANIVSTYLECGLQECHGDFLTYKVKLFS